MSVEALKWARLADVKKSSSKLVLLSLAQLVRYDASEWTVFASVEYLSRVTHLNRKTVIDALARLRALGAIQDTGRRTGDNCCSIVYLLSPISVPLIDQSGPKAVAGGEPSRGPGGTNQQRGIGPDGTAAACQRDGPPGTEATASSHGPSAVGHDTLGSAVRSEPARHRPAPCQPPEQRLAQPSRGQGACRLPDGWTLPETWKQWTLRQRPHWTPNKVDAMAAMFHAYVRSRPTTSSVSADWFESWKLWVFRERDAGGPAKSWQDSWSGIVKKGKDLNLYQAPDEPEPHFKARVLLHAASRLP